MSGHDLRRGAMLAAGAALSFACMGALIKAAAAELPTSAVVFLRNLFGLLLLSPWLLRGGWRRLGTRRLPLHLARTAIGLSAMYCFFWALARLPLADAVLLSYSTPLYIPFIAWLWLGERPAPALLPVILLGLLGVALILRPDGQGLVSAAGAVGALAGLFAAGAFVAVRRLSLTEPSFRIVFLFTLCALIISALPAAWQWQWPPPRLYLLMAGVGGFATIGQLLLTRAYGCAPAAQIAPFNYLVVVWAGLLGWLSWGETPDAWSLGGSALVVLSSIMALRLRMTAG